MKISLKSPKLSENSGGKKRKYLASPWYYTYILLCSDDSYYTGVTNDLDRRLFEHNNSTDEKSYTYSRRPVEVVYFECYKYVLDAIAREKQIKKWSRAKKEALIRNDLVKLKELAKCKNESASPRLRSV